MSVIFCGVLHRNPLLALRMLAKTTAFTGFVLRCGFATNIGLSAFGLNRGSTLLMVVS
jgi:hypothetical protein